MASEAMTEQQINERVVVEVMGWRKGDRGYWDNQGDASDYRVVEWSPATKIEDAREVIAVLKKRDVQLQMQHTGGQYRARFFTTAGPAYWQERSNDGDYWEYADTAPMAICLAALAALDVAKGAGK
jgi:hypothetical protein